MSHIKVNGNNYKLSEYQDEKEIELALNDLSEDIFGKSRIYINVKKLIGKENKGIPDGYLLDLSSKKPEFYFVEVELQQHHLIKHIAVQILNFKLAFDEDKEKIKKILLDQIEKDQKIKDKCTKYALNNDYENLHNLIDKMVNGSEFQTIIVIDESDPSVEKNLLNNFKFETSILNLRKYESSDDNKIYQFDTFDEETGTDSYTENNDDQEIIDKSKFDTIVVPARKDGFERVFIGENRWYKIKFSKKIQPQIKYIAVYQTKPISQITHLAEIDNVKPWEDTLKYVVNFKSPAQKLSQPIKYVHGGKTWPVYRPRFAEHSKLINAKTLDDLWT